ncbi:DEAD/DEAH box helicase [Candidatus Dependentiae bacterium]|nr:DEAD/DEAH box helicase [Candidatus Dependentiae bacterium]
MRYTPHQYQDFATKHLIDNPAAGLFLEMGLGKTVSTLTGIDELKYNRLEVDKVLVVAPKRVAESTWKEEIEKWDHLKHLKLSLVLGSEKERKHALQQQADIYVINRENLVWLVAYYGGAWPFDMVVLDELSSFKSPKSARFKAMRQVRPKVKRIVGLTGTPAPNSLLDLWAPMYLLDMGERLGKTIGSYRDKYFKPNRRNGHVVYDYVIKKEDKLLGEDIYVKEIYEKIGDICISMKAKDWLNLPERMDIDVPVHLSPVTQKLYNDFERTQILALGDLEHISAVNAGALTNKLLQFAGGAIYKDDGYHIVHDEKLDALEELIEDNPNETILIAYWYEHELERLKKRLAKYGAETFKGDETKRRWNEGKIRILLAHPASVGHGLNLQYGGHVLIWYSQIWSLELYQQFVTRLDRQGQVFTVRNYRLIAMNTMDQDVIKSQDLKSGGQEALMQAVKARIQKYRNAVAA